MAGPRNFLFAPDSADVALTQLLATARRVTGFMDGAPGAPLPGWYQPGGDNRAVLENLHGRLATAFPDAGTAFHAVRLWTNLVWQPAYLAVIAVHVHGAVPDLRTMTQAIKGIDISGFRMVAGSQHRAAPEAMIAQAGADLRALANEMLGEINAITRLKPITALRLLADRILGLMLRLEHYAGLDAAGQKRMAALWMEATGLTGQGDLASLSLQDGNEVLILERKGCCLDYRAFPGRYCSSCPKQDSKIRISRQTDEAIAEREVSA